MVMLRRECYTFCGRSAAPPLQTCVARIYVLYQTGVARIYALSISVMRACRWFVASIMHFAGGAQLRPYRPASQEFMYHI